MNHQDRKLWCNSLTVWCDKYMSRLSFDLLLNKKDWLLYTALVSEYIRGVSGIKYDIKSIIIVIIGKCMAENSVLKRQKNIWFEDPKDENICYNSDFMDSFWSYIKCTFSLFGILLFFDWTFVFDFKKFNLS